MVPLPDASTAIRPTREGSRAASAGRPSGCGRGSLQSGSSHGGLVADVPRAGHAPSRKREVCGPQEVDTGRDRRPRSAASLLADLQLLPRGTASTSGRSERQPATDGSARTRSGAIIAVLIGVVLAGPRDRREDRRASSSPSASAASAGASSTSRVARSPSIVRAHQGALSSDRPRPQDRPLRRVCSRRSASLVGGYLKAKERATCRARSAARRATPPRRRRRRHRPRDLTDLECRPAPLSSGAGSRR